MDEKNNINQTLESIAKAMNTPAAAGLAGAGMTLMRENLASSITRLTNRETNIRDRLTRKTGSGMAASWNVLTQIGVGNSPFAEGGTPTEDATVYARRTAIYKELGKVKAISDRMISAGKSFTDIEAELTEVAMREVIQDEEQLIVTGDSGASVLEFDGLDTYITTNRTDDANNALGFRTEILETEIAKIQSTYGVRVTAIYCSYGMKKAINQYLAGDVRVNLDASNEVGIGVDVTFYQSMIGKLPFIATTAIADDTTSYPGNTVSNIYLVTEKTQGQDVLYMEDMQDYSLGKKYLDRTGAAIKFMVTEATTLVCRAEEFQAVIENVRVS